MICHHFFRMYKRYIDSPGGFYCVVDKFWVVKTPEVTHTV
jgi:hypothetical protein